jgi:hypothetical protein
MTSIGVQEKVLNSFRNSFKDASIQIHMRKRFLKNYIEKSVHAGCFLSSTLFNIGTGPFIMNIRENIKNLCIITMKIIQRFRWSRHRQMISWFLWVREKIWIS